MRKLIGFVLGALLLGGCAVYAEPVPPPVGFYVGPPVVVAPAPHVWWGWHDGWHHHGR